MNKPTCLGQLVTDDLVQAQAGRRTAPFEKKAYSAATIGLSLPGKFAQRINRGLPCCITAILREPEGAIRIVKVQNGGLGKSVRATVAVGMFRIAFNLRRPPFMRLDQKRN